jgi:uncharacterized protein (DUF924 family)
MVQVAKSANRASSLISRVHSYWFKDFVRGVPPTATSRELWFKSTANQDAAMRSHFKEDLDAFWRELQEETVQPFRTVDESDEEEGRSLFADRKDELVKLPGEYSPLLKTPQGALALSILGGGLARGIYRGERDAFERGEGGRMCAWLALTEEMDKGMDEVEASFFIVPLMQVESPSSQQSAMSYAVELHQSAPLAYRDYLQAFTSLCKAHSDVIDRFGRFPIRNQVLGRKSTAEELKYLLELEFRAQAR